MKTLHASSQYKKDLKRYRNNPKKVERLFKILKYLAEEIPIPVEYHPHELTGDYSGCMECHIESDYLLIWFDPESDQIDLLRLGSHSELFGKGLKR